MSAGRTVALAVAISFLVPGFVSCSSSGAAEDGFVALIESVSAADMMTTVGDLQAFGSREFHLESSHEAAEYIYGRLVETGLAVEYQEFELDGINISNVVAVKEGDDPDAGCFLFGAHYDSENRLVDSLSAAENITAPGADDDASGVAAVIELARLLSDVALRNTVKFVAFAAEEYGYDNSGGLKGSHHFVASEVEGNVSYEGTAISATGPGWRTARSSSPSNRGTGWRRRPSRRSGSTRSTWTWRTSSSRGSATATTPRSGGRATRACS
jgi:hypothetical protein